MQLLAPAKINLHLRVGPRDGSGFHPLVSWLCSAGLFDTLILRKCDEPAIHLSCDDPTLACDSSNLVMRAAETLKQMRPESTGADILLQKRIPIGGGLGGGSSDAARTLLGLNRLWDWRLPIERLHEIGATLGSDVPFFLYGPSSICTGRGQIVRPIAAPRPRWALLIFPERPLSTAEVYRKFDEMNLAAADFSHEPAWAQWASLASMELLPRLGNDLEPAAFALAADLGSLRDALEASLSRVIRMTGSGSTLFTLFDQADDAQSAARVVQAQYPLRVVAAELAPRIEDNL
jgi:4-diphosphocytidyl-2-C-methyl-D-erythritol kinase